MWQRPVSILWSIIFILVRVKDETRIPFLIRSTTWKRIRKWLRTSENPLVHYLEKGAAEGRDPGPDFDTAYYLEMSPDVAHAGGNVAHSLSGVRHP